MRARIWAVKGRVASYGRVVAGEALELLRRRKLSYAALALILTAGSLYVSGIRPTLVTSEGQAPGPSADDRNTSPKQLEPLQTVTGQGTDKSGGTSSQDSTARQQTHTSVTVNGTDIPVPANGEVHTTLNNDGSTTSVSVSHDSSSGSSYSSLDVQVFSQDSAGEEGN